MKSGNTWLIGLGGCGLSIFSFFFGCVLTFAILHMIGTQMVQSQQNGGSSESPSVYRSNW